MLVEFILFSSLPLSPLPVSCFPFLVCEPRALRMLGSGSLLHYRHTFTDEKKLISGTFAPFLSLQSSFVGRSEIIYNYDERNNFYRARTGTGSI